MYNPIRDIVRNVVVDPLLYRVKRRVYFGRVRGILLSPQWAGHVIPADGYELRFRSDGPSFTMEVPGFVSALELGDHGWTLRWSSTRDGLSFNMGSGRVTCSNIVVAPSHYSGPPCHWWVDTKGGAPNYGRPDNARPFVDFVIGGVRVRGVSAAERARADREPALEVAT